MKLELINLLRLIARPKLSYTAEFVNYNDRNEST